MATDISDDNGSFWKRVRKCVVVIEQVYDVPNDLTPAKSLGSHRGSAQVTIRSSGRVPPAAMISAKVGMGT